MPKVIRVADEVWIATASLHRRHPERADFTVDEIMEQAETAGVTGMTPLRPACRAHVEFHCVANKAPGRGRYRMLLETPAGRRRLFRPGDPCHPRRTAGRHVPKRGEIPAAYRELIDWYGTEYAAPAGGTVRDPVLALRGMGKAVWADETADAYVRRQRSGWP